MAKPRFSFKVTAPAQQRVFVNRQEAIALFKEMRDTVKGSGCCRILNYYGIGGIGKSALRRELMKSHLGNRAISFSMDCQNHENLGSGDSLIALVDSCECSKQVRFPLFERAYAGYFSKKHPDLASGREREHFSKRFKIGLNILELVDGGIFGLAANIADISYDAIDKARIPKEIKQDLENFTKYSLFDIEMRLPAYFAADLENIVSKHGFVPIFFIDTFEAVNEHESRKERCFENEEWARDLIANVSEGLAVIFGRDPIDWGSEWADSITSYRLAPLEQNHSMSLLDHLGVKNDEVRRVLQDKAKGFPLYLTLLSDTYRQNPEISSLSLENDSHLATKILNRFLYNLTDQEAETLRILSIANYFTRDLLEYAVTSFNTGFSFTRFEEFTSYSFIERSNENYFIQRNVRDIVSASLDPSLRSRAHRMFSDYYDKAFSESGQYEQLYQMTFHKANHLDADSLTSWVSAAIRPAIDEWRIKGERRKTYDLLQMLLETLDFDSLEAPLLSSYTDIVHLGGDYQRSVELIAEYLDGKTSQKLDPQTLLYLQTRKLHHAMFYESAKDLLAEAIALRENCDYVASDAIVELDFLIGGNLSVLAGDFDCAKKWLEIARTEGHICGMANIEARIDRKLAETMLALNDLDATHSILGQHRKLLDKANEDLTRYEAYLIGTLGEYFRAIGDTIAAKSCFEKLLSITQERGMPGWEAHAFLAHALLDLQVGAYDNAFNFAGKAYALYSQTQHCWGIANSLIVLDALSSQATTAHKAPPNQSAGLSAKEICQKMGYSYQAQFAGKETLSNFRLLFL